MPFDYRIEPDSLLAVMTGVGEIDFDSFVAVLERLRADSAFRPHTAILLDVREALNEPPPGTAPRLADKWKSLAAGHAVAIVVGTLAAYGVARQISILTDGQVMAFKDIDEALQWLPRRHPSPRSPA